MVRLKREIEGLKRDEKKALPAYLGDDVGRTVLDRHAEHRMMEIPFERGGRSLAVSPSESQVRLLLQNSSHVSVVENDPERLTRLMDSLKDVEDVRTLTFHSKPYSEISFERSSFDFIISLDDLNWYHSPGNAVRKYGRELKVSGLFLGRCVLNRENEETNLPGEWAISEREFKRESDGGFRTDVIQRFSATGIVLGRMATRLNALPSWVREKALRGTMRLDAALSTEVLEGVPALSYIVGGKALGFGTVFHKDLPEG